MKIHSLGYLFREGLKGLWKNRTMTLASVGVLLSCLFLMGFAGLLSMNISSMMESMEGKNMISIFLKNDVPTLKSIQVEEKLRAIGNIGECTFVPRQQGLENVIDMLGDSGEILYGLSGDRNFLPDAYNITMSDLNLYNDTIKQIKAIEEVDDITDFSETASKLNSLDLLVRYASIAVVLVLGVVSIFIISNTIKVTMFSRRSEINIMKSVGATNGFVRVPFIVEGIVIGILAGGISASLMYVAYQKVMETIYQVVPYMGLGINIQPYIFWIYLLYCFIGAMFGVLGCGISIGKYLKKEGEQAII